jgi:hypothetical protein
MAGGGIETVIPRYQIVLFAILLAASAAMGAELWHLRQRAHERLLSGEVTTPTKAPEVAPAVRATLMVANDAEGSVTPQVLSLPLPVSPNERARAILGKLLDLYAAPGSTHQVPGGAASILQVFLLPTGRESAAAKSRSPVNAASKAAEPGPEMAVVNVAAAFANSHPSGIETETLTLLSMCDTLHANLPRITAVRFLVDGHPRATLSGHADLSRTYLPSETAPALPVNMGASQ